MRMVSCILLFNRRYNFAKVATSSWVCKQCVPIWANHPVHLIWTPFDAGKPEHWVGPHQYHFIKDLWVHIVSMDSLAAVFLTTALQRQAPQNNLSALRVISSLRLTASEGGRGYFCVSNLCSSQRKITEFPKSTMVGWTTLHPVPEMGVVIQSLNISSPRRPASRPSQTFSEVSIGSLKGASSLLLFLV